MYTIVIGIGIGIGILYAYDHNSYTPLQTFPQSATVMFSHNIILQQTIFRSTDVKF